VGLTLEYCRCVGLFEQIEVTAGQEAVCVEAVEVSIGRVSRQQCLCLGTQCVEERTYFTTCFTQLG